MEDFFNIQLLDNSVKQWLITLGIILFAFLFKHTFSESIAKFIVRFFDKKKYGEYSHYFLQKIINPLELFVFWLITMIALDKLQYPAALNFDLFRNYSLKKFLDTASQVFIIICFFRLLIGINYFIGFVIRENSDKINNRSANQAMALVSDIVKVVLIIIAAFIILKITFNYNISSLLTSLGLVTAALALAAKETVENTICSFIILFDRPFLVGDFIKVNNVSGNVEKIGIRSTRIRTPDKTLISIPNKIVVGGALENTSDQTRRRYSRTIEVALNISEEKMKNLLEKIRNIIDTEKDIIQDDSSLVCLLEVGTQSNKIYIEYSTWMNLSFAQFRALNENINLQIIKAMQEAEIEFYNNTAPSAFVVKNPE